ncbi:GntR family transcriptional regulator [Frigidibacter sp. MR17.14]|uniref:GntR family transcriptional regulator n=1 Tax=Frigidibacter sp. MR17.14 TaxID=3126509 RepID=UPI00301302A6
MARDNRLFKAQVNRLLDRLAAGGAEALGSEAELAQALDASRTTVRAVLSHLAGAGVLAWDGREKRLLRAPSPADYFDVEETRGSHALIEERFLQWVLQGDVPPGTVLNETQLARQFDVPLAAVREFLIRFEPFGLIEKTPNRHWVLKGFTRAFAEEMFDVRLMFERRALDRLIAEPDPDLLKRLELLAEAHRAVIGGGEDEALAFPELDARFHAWICAGARNRFIADFSRTIAIIVHYHYLWNKKDEVGRNRDAAAEHLVILDAVRRGDAPAAMAALDRHLATARRTLLASVIWTDS